MSFLDSTQLTLEAAMRGSMSRENVLTNDLVNADTPGYSPEDVNFQQTLASAVAGGQSPSSVSFTPYTTSVVNSADGNGVNTDQTEADISENALLYQELSQVAEVRNSIMQTAINTTTS